MKKILLSFMFITIFKITAMETGSDEIKIDIPSNDKHQSGSKWQAPDWMEKDMRRRFKNELSQAEQENNVPKLLKTINNINIQNHIDLDNRMCRYGIACTVLGASFTMLGTWLALIVK